jgi:hypothetical protein
VKDNKQALLDAWEGMKKGHHPTIATAEKPLAVADFEIVGDRKIKILFNNGAQRVLDFLKYKEEWDTEIFKSLTDQELFKQAKLTSETIEWPDGLEIDPDDLWDLSEPIQSAA